MKLLIFGASGRTGRIILEKALLDGHSVTAFVRNPQSLKILNKKLTIFQGDVSHTDDVTKAIKGQDIVISALGNKAYDIWHANTVISDGVKNILLGMKKQKVKHLIFMTSFGVSKHIFLPERFFVKTVLHNIFLDIPTQEAMIEKSGLEWTIIRPARLTDGPFTGKYRRGEDLPIWPWSHISRSDVGDFIMKNLENKEWIHKKVTISY